MRNAIRYSAEERGISIRKIAKETGYGYAHVQKCLTTHPRDQRMSMPTLLAIADYLGIEVEVRVRIPRYVPYEPADPSLYTWEQINNLTGFANQGGFESEEELLQFFTPRVQRKLYGDIAEQSSERLKRMREIVLANGWEIRPFTGVVDYIHAFPDQQAVADYICEEAGYLTPIKIKLDKSQVVAILALREGSAEAHCIGIDGRRYTGCENSDSTLQTTTAPRSEIGSPSASA